MADFRDYIGMDASAFLMHYGKGHLDGGHSGRYPYGSTSNVKGGREPATPRKLAQKFFSDNSVVNKKPDWGAADRGKLTPREKKAITLGVNAVKKWDRFDNAYDEDMTPMDLADWFVWEDQTIGYYEVADLVAQGKSKKQIESILQEASNIHKGIRESGYDYKDSFGDQAEVIGDLDDFNVRYKYTVKYLDECIRLNEEERKKNR